MPKRATLTYSSEDAPNLAEEKLHVYYCLYSGKHAFTLDCDIATLPRRCTDGSYVLDTSTHLARLYTTDGQKKLIRRKDGKVERQHRINVGELPVAYRSQPGSRVLYILPEAVSTLAGYHQQVKAQGKAPVPPCITAMEGGTGSLVTLAIEDQASRPAIIKVTADGVRLQICAGVQTPKAEEELLELLSKALTARLTHLRLLRGSGTRHKVLAVEGQAPEVVAQRLQAALGSSLGFVGMIPPSGTERGGWRSQFL